MPSLVEQWLIEERDQLLYQKQRRMLTPVERQHLEHVLKEIHARQLQGVPCQTDAPPGGGVMELTANAREIGHVLETVEGAAGGALAKCVLHFN